MGGPEDGLLQSKKICANNPMYEYKIKVHDDLLHPKA